MKSTLFAAAIASVLGSGASFADQGDWLIRGRLLNVSPNESATINPIGGDVDIDTSFVPELDISYFFTDRIAAELILGVTPHDVMAVGTAAGNVDLGDVTLLPPTLTLQYHFLPEGTIHPYVGAGINYTVFFNEDLPAGGIATSINYDNSFGLALQGGIDFDVNENWFFNVDVKYIDINTDVTINNAITADVDIDPWVFGIGIGRRF
ncbi:OmpW/AlkL family protein [Hyphobacterium indicum]|jgi:outer membrane protein|uniref:OmpW/AlkL family protein n=1 Tax=Hyphobacterium indicum TaxID=2162714 RepID=UPI000D6546FC|nr:OmpW family protein [Hyphobacterium indicum]|tara:strand:- start:840 stop:1460 length:621 start_codon:yes stop_codon:yes gene_type:complete